MHMHQVFERDRPFSTANVCIIQYLQGAIDAQGCVSCRNAWMCVTDRPLFRSLLQEFSFENREWT